MDTPEGIRMYNFQHKLKALKANMRMWNKEEFGNIFEDKKRLIQDIHLIRHKGMESGWDMEMKEKEKDLLIQLDARERHEEIYWKQKSRVKWLREGEKNSKFFHNSVIHNRLGSKIHKIKMSDGTQVENRWEVKEELTIYFKGIMTEYNNDSGHGSDHCSHP